MQLNSVFREWLARRKITDSIIEEFGIHGEHEIIIPVTDVRGHFAFNKYRRSPLSDSGAKYRYDKGGTVTLYGASKISDVPGDILVTEGEMDCLVAWSANIAAVTSTGGALSFQKEWIPLFTGKRLAVCFDNDQSGGDGMARVWEMDKGAGFVFLPDRAGVKDISDYVGSGGDLAELVKTARTYAGEEEIRADRAERLALWKSVYFHDAVLKRIDEHKRSERPKQERIRDMNADKVSEAKKHPITELIRFSQGKARCLFHAEKTASMHYFGAENRVYCFGCGRRGDAIDVYRQIHNCGFKEAVEALI